MYLTQKVKLEVILGCGDSVGASVHHGANLGRLGNKP